jgi:hypothetical protein
VFSEHGKQLNGHLVCVGIIDRDEFNTRFKQTCNEEKIPAESIELGYNQNGFIALA